MPRALATTPRRPERHLPRLIAPPQGRWDRDEGMPGELSKVEVTSSRCPS